MAEVMTINEIVQLGVETTAGQSPVGGSNVKLSALDLKMDPDFSTEQFAASGHRFDTLSVPNMEKSKLSGDGKMTYTEVLYPQSGVYGGATITTPAGGVNARQWLQSPLLTGVVTGKTYQAQRGSAARARQVNYAQFTDFGFSADRKEAAKITVAGFAGRITDGATLTSSPTSIPLVPVEAQDWNIYLDTLSANIGTTKLARCFAASFGYTGAYGDVWVMDRAQTSFATVTNLKPSLAVSLTLEADDSTTLSDIWTQARNAGKVYIRFNAQSAIMADNYQTLTITGTPTGGTFTLSYKSQTTAAINYNALAADVQTALEALSTIGAGNVTCSGGPLPGSAVTITMAGALANDTTAITSTDSFTGGTSPASSIVVTSIPYSYTHDVCCVPAPDAFQDTDGIYTQTWNFFVVEDPNWTAGNADGTAIVTKVITTLTAL